MENPACFATSGITRYPYNSLTRLSTVSWIVMTGRLHAACGFSVITASNVLVGETEGANNGELAESAGFQIGRYP